MPEYSCLMIIKVKKANELTPMVTPSDFVIGVSIVPLAIPGVYKTCVILM